MHLPHIIQPVNTATTDYCLSTASRKNKSRYTSWVHHTGIIFVSPCARLQLCSNNTSHNNAEAQQSTTHSSSHEDAKKNTIVSIIISVTYLTTRTSRGMHKKELNMTHTHLEGGRRPRCPPSHALSAGSNYFYWCFLLPGRRRWTAAVVKGSTVSPAACRNPRVYEQQ